MKSFWFNLTPDQQLFVLTVALWMYLLGVVTGFCAK